MSLLSELQRAGWHLCVVAAPNSPRVIVQWLRLPEKAGPQPKEMCASAPIVYWFDAQTVERDIGRVIEEQYLRVFQCEPGNRGINA